MRALVVEADPWPEGDPAEQAMRGLDRADAQPLGGMVNYRYGADPDANWSSDPLSTPVAPAAPAEETIYPRGTAARGWARG